MRKVFIGNPAPMWDNKRFQTTTLAYNIELAQTCLIDNSNTERPSGGQKKTEIMNLRRNKNGNEGDG